MQTVTSTEKKLQEIVAEKLMVPPAQVPLDKSLTEELQLDSFDLMSVILEIEETFEPVTISERSAEDLRTLRDVAQYIDAEIAA